MKTPVRVGHGYDVHRFSEGRKLILGGVEIPFDKGLLGHSDADVLLHAICDSILGALALGDIGKHFPDSDNAFKDIDSKKLLSKVCSVMDEYGYAVGNVDCTLILEKPKISAYTTKMREIISSILNVDISQVSIKATTSEKLGFVGREEGAEAFASAILLRKEF